MALKGSRRGCGNWGRVAWAALLAAAMAVPGQAAEEKKIPPPEDVVKDTADGLQLAFTYYGSADGKEAVPVILLHMWKGKRGDYRDLALYLQRLGHAVVVPDLRGHGESTKFRGGGALEAAKLTPAQFSAMWMYDVETLKAFLWKENNEGRCNLNRLCLVGAEMGASVALGSAAYDWAVRGAPNTYPFYGPRQVGAFTKAAVLLSPEWQFKGQSANVAIRGLEQPTRLLGGPAFPVEQIAFMILVGAENAKQKDDGEKIEKLLKRHHPEPEGENKKEKKTLFFGALNTSLQGTKMLGVKQLRVEQHIATFIDLRLVKSVEARALTWQVLKGA